MIFGTNVNNYVLRRAYAFERINPPFKKYWKYKFNSYSQEFTPLDDIGYATIIITAQQLKHETPGFALKK